MGVIIMSYIRLNEIFQKIEIGAGDILLIGSDITLLALESLRNGEKFNADNFIDCIIEKVGDNGTIMFPTYNWDFCKGVGFDYNKTLSKTGALTTAVLKRKDFKRTKHPIYSFAVWGKDQQYLCNLENVSSFGGDSPFGYLHKQNAKMLIIGLDYQRSFTFVHHVEEMENAPYRYHKNFTAPYINEDGIEEVRTYSMYVRNLEPEVFTQINPIGNELERQGASYHFVINTVDFYLIDLARAYRIIKDDIVFNGGKRLHIVTE
ncbi:AAC(3) family N-acetyltransferase [Schinkia azotoformans]|uniref:AAC(3) family N-acetyltransferase n=1 Tax=Schinkia azotoformans TaxID=1454 RepID=UPI002DB59D58|nr:AAC(3) family N-acetyltransferase [Schinkia azotoformans]MEC1743429.1 AAC(3) family N-acetyltransferase [Schinkia azotoformans]MEC1768371.1 AAC(3) family N-acetyltransferase [Schinkia azotoformans]MEC1781532.1 AAC(3) family N-acetyltransferase [Schinkia azotoformans]MED4329781.1 AAC(3) family N-acetyltransferase [Schinkia azotoformans]MED4376268.1 AAC(3) family N-acetyltransferase [Schinkia azotoformans]